MTGTSDSILILNPNAGRGLAQSMWQQLADTHPELRDVPTIRQPDAEQARAQLLERLSDERVRRVVAVGGDGTANLAVNCIIGSGCARRVGLGLVGAGTGSDFVRSFTGLSKRAALEHFLVGEGETRSVDLIEIEPESSDARLCLNETSAGLSGAVAAGLASGARGTSYLLRTLGALFAYTPLACRVIVDGEVIWEDELFLVAIANGRYFGNGMKVAPKAEIDDGLLDVIVVPSIPKWQLPVRLPQFIRGTHVRLQQVLSLQAREVRLEPGPDLPPIEYDGETLPAQPVTLRVLPRALRLLV